jgi:preprotein translocase subunit SecB
MSNAVLKAVMSPEISFINQLPNGTQLKLDTKFAYNVKYAKDLHCRAEMTVEARAKDAPDKFCIKTVIVGIFNYNESDDKDLLHVETFKTLFPYARALVSTITANTGIPPIILPEINIEGQNIYRIEKGNL